MKYDVAAVDDIGDKFRVRYVDTYQNSILKNDGYYIKISNVAGDIIRNAISEHKKVYIPKNVPGELTIRDVVVDEVDGLEKDKMIALSDAYRKVDYQIFNVGAIDYFEFLNIFSRLASLGYFITDQNREEKYIEIIETGNEDLIEELEIYLEKKDNLDKISYVYNKTKDFEKKVMTCGSKEELDIIVENFYNS